MCYFQFSIVNWKFENNKLLLRSTIQLLRFHFSLFLLPVFLFALSQVPHINWMNVFLVFTVLHVLVYPSSNGYNSYMDRDETAIGGLSKPLQPTRQLFFVSVMMDLLALVLSIFISPVFALGEGRTEKNTSGWTNCFFKPLSSWSRHG